MAGILDVVKGGSKGGRVVGMALGLALTFLGTTLGGCSSVSKEQYDQVVQENEGLRQQVTQSQSAAKQNEQQLTSLQAENAQLKQAAAQPQTGPGWQQGTDERPQRGKSGGDNDVSTRTIGTVNFGPGSVSLSKDAMNSLNSIASNLKGKYSNADVRVEGHADGAKPTKGKYKSNEELSEARAESVKRYLVQKGVSSSRITTVGRGSTTSKVSKDGRRADVIVIGAN